MYISRCKWFCITSALNRLNAVNCAFEYSLFHEAVCSIFEAMWHFLCHLERTIRICPQDFFYLPTLLSDYVLHICLWYARSTSLCLITLLRTSQVHRSLASTTFAFRNLSAPLRVTITTVAQNGNWHHFIFMTRPLFKDCY